MGAATTGFFARRCCTHGVCGLRTSHNSTLHVPHALSGELQPGDRVPGVTALMPEYGIARTTAGKVLALLRDEGLITVVPGWGSFVKK
jgi:Bacterial regulatory proteins, gntR family